MTKVAVQALSEGREVSRRDASRFMGGAPGRRARQFNTPPLLKIHVAVNPVSLKTRPAYYGCISREDRTPSVRT
jgi:hypothetical protein